MKFIAVNSIPCCGFKQDNDKLEENLEFSGLLMKESDDCKQDFVMVVFLIKSTTVKKEMKKKCHDCFTNKTATMKKEIRKKRYAYSRRKR